jgi:hypothetical protein
MYDDDKGVWCFNEKIHKKIIEKYSTELFPNIYEADKKKSFSSIYKIAYELLRQNALLFLLLNGLKIIHK